MKQLALWAIRFYQRFISPYKGFVCAYRQHSGHASCSALGYRSIRFYGVWRGIIVLRQRLKRCGEVHQQCQTRRPALLQQQSGFCDVPCDVPCEPMHCDDHFSRSLCDVCSCCDGCDWPSGRKKDKATRRSRAPAYPAHLK